MIATLATRADEAGIKTTVVSTDRDAFQLVTDNVALMMTPRGVSDVHVYTPERVEARYGIKPEQIPDFIGLKGDSSDNIPGIPGIGDKTAGQLIAQYGSVEEVIEHADELSPARKKNVIEFADQARLSKELATMRRDLDIDCDPAELVLQPPDRSQLREMFRRFEFRNLLNRIDELDDAVPALERIVAGTAVAVARGRAARSGSPAASASRSTTTASRSRRTTASSSARGATSSSPRLRDAQIVAHDYKALPRLTQLPAEDTMIAAYLIEPGRPAYELDDLAAEYGVEALPRAGGGGGDGGARPRGRGAAAARRRRCARACASAAARSSTTASSCRSPPCSRRWRTPGIKIDTYRMGEITARLADRVEELEAKAYELAGEEFMLGSTQQVARILFEKLELTPGRKGKTGYSTDTRVLPLDPARARDRRGDRGVARADEAASTRTSARCRRCSARTAGCTRTSTRRSRRPGACRRRTRTCRRSRSAPSSAARSAARSSPSRGTASSRPTTRRSSCASSRTSPASRGCATRSRAARTSTPRRRPRCSARIRRR